MGKRKLYNTVILTEEDQEAGHAATWRKVLKNAPVAQYKVDANGKITDEIEYYYVYTFEEEDIPGYTLKSQSYNDKTYHVTFTNTHQPKLPFTGGSGDLLFVAIGAVLILFALTTGKTRRKAKRQGRYKAM